MRLHPFCLTGLLAIYLVLLPPVSGSAQRSWDHQVLSTLPDSNAIMAKIRSAQQFRRLQPDKSLRLLVEALNESHLSAFDRGVRNALLNLAQLHYFQERYKTCIQTSQLLRQSVDKVLQQGADSAFHNETIFYSYHFEALSFHAMDRIDSAIESYFHALAFIPDTFPKVIGIYCNIGELYCRMGSGDNALIYLNQGIEWYEANNPEDLDAQADLAALFINKGYVYRQQMNFAAANSAFKRALQIAKRLDDPILIYNVYRFQAALYNAMSEPGKALVAINKAKDLLASYKIPNQRNALYQIDLSAGEAYFRQGHYRLAEQSLQAALEKIDSFEISGLAVIHRKLSRVYYRTGNFKMAYHSVLEADELDKQIKNKEIQSRLNEANIRYQTAEKNSELAQKNILLSNYQRDIAQKNLLITSVSSGLLIVLLLFWNARRHYRRRKRLVQQEQEIGQLKAVMTGEEKERVRLARELHDGVGSMLATIKLNVGSIQQINRDAAVGTRLEAITTMLQETSTEVRTAAHNLVPDVLIKYGIGEAILQYIQRLDAQHNMRISLHMPAPLPDLSKTVELVLYRMVQELIQNVIKHASATQITVQLLAYDNTISLSVEDNGKGMETEPGTASGFGLDNLRYRVQALHGDMSIDSLAGEGTIVHISFKPEQLE